MEILFIGVANTEDALEESQIKYYKGKAQVRPQQYFDLALTMGLSKQCNVTTVSLPPVASYPKSSCLYYKRNKEKVNGNLEINYISLMNLPIIKTVNIIVNVFLRTFLFLLKNRKQKPVILCGYIAFETTLPALLVAKLFNTKIFAMVPDVPLFLGTYSKFRNPIGKIINTISIKINRYLEVKFNGYVFLTQAMNNLINRNQKEYIVVEGMIYKESIDSNINYEKKKRKIIMYAGTLHEKFGIKKLVEAFIKANLKDYELWIFGSGDYEENLEEVTNNFSNIIFKGSVSKSKILSLEKKATLLINPRPSSEKFTEYSFPSKTLEYMASGTPLLTTKLSGIPEDYDDYLYYFKDESIEGMANRIKEILNYPTEELRIFGFRAKNYVLNYKNSLVQSKKIYKYLDENV